MDQLSNTPAPPYYAVIFSSILSENTEGYEDMAKKMVDLAPQQQGFLGMESARNEIGITVSYWKDLESIKKWRDQSDHTIAREMGRSLWYKNFITRIALVEKSYQL